MRRSSVLSGTPIDFPSVKFLILLFFSCILLVSMISSATAYAVPVSPWYSAAKCPMPGCLGGIGGIRATIAVSPAAITTSGQATVEVTAKVDAGKMGVVGVPMALVVFYITGTRPDGTSIANPAQYLSNVCDLTEDDGTGSTTLRNAVPGNYYINAQIECRDPGALDAPYQVMITVTSPVTPPVASFTVITPSGPAPLQVSFDAMASSAAAGIDHYSWNFGDGRSSPDVRDSWMDHTFTTAGTYTVILTVTDRNSQTATTTRQVIVKPPVQNTAPVASFTADPTSGKAPLNVLFDASASSDTEDLTFLSSYSWNFGDGSTGQSKSLYHQYQNPGTYTATLTVTDQGGLPGSATRQIFVEKEQVNTAPVASFTATPSSGQAPLTVQFNAGSSSDPDGIGSYSWNYGDGSSGSGAISSHMYTSPGSYTAILTVIDQGSPKLPGSTTRQITVTDIPNPNMDPVAMFTVGRSSGESLVVQFDASGSTDSDGSITAYTWDFGDGKTGTGQKVTHTYASASQYPVTLRVQDNQRGSGTFSLQITVGGNQKEDTKPQVQFTIRQSTDAVATANSITGDASASTDPDGIIVYYWNWGDGTKVEMGATPVLSHTYASPGQYVVSVSAVDSTGSSGSASQQITVGMPATLPVASFTARLGSYAIVRHVLFDGSSSSGPDKITVYEWDYGDGTRDSSSRPTIAHQYQSFDKYQVTLRVQDARGQSGTTTQEITLTREGLYTPKPQPVDPLVPILALIAGVVILLRRR